MMKPTHFQSELWQGYYTYIATASMAAALAITGVFLLPVWMLFLV
jgi:hypothetical protein